MDCVKTFLLKFQPGALKTLPLCSPIAQKIANQAEEGHITELQLTKAFSSDPVLAARLCGAANSIFFNLTNRDVWSTEECLRRVGNKYASELLLVSAAATRELRSGKLLKEVWQHSNEVAEVAKTLCETMNLSAAETEAVRLAALIHDIGYVVVANYGKETKSVIESLHDEATQTTDHQQHATLGAALASAWTIPPLLCNAIEYHHEPHHLSESVAKKISCFVHVAEKLVYAQTEYTDAERALCLEYGIDVETVKASLYRLKNAQ